jgi:hypothetical protein
MMPDRRQVIRRTLFALCLLGANYLARLALMLTVLLLFFRDDPISAAVPAALALPVMVLQPWFLVFFFIPVGAIVAPLLTTAFTIFVYGWLNSDGRLDRPKELLLKFKTRRTAMVAGTIVLLAIAIMAARYVDFPATHRGTPPSIQISDITINQSRSYCLVQFIDSEWLWQARVSESDLSSIAERYNLHPIDVSVLPDEFRSMPPYWWRSSITHKTRALSTPRFPLNERGPDGRYALATWNPDDQLLQVWIKDNF